MDVIDERAALADRADSTCTGEEASAQKAGIDREKKDEKPEASEEIVIEEISIDGMCGVY